MVLGGENYAIMAVSLPRVPNGESSWKPQDTKWSPESFEKKTNAMITNSWSRHRVTMITLRSYWLAWSLMTFDYTLLWITDGWCYSPDGRVNPSEIGYSPDDRADLPELGYSPDSPMTKLIKPKCPNTSHM